MKRKIITLILAALGLFLIFASIYLFLSNKYRKKAGLLIETEPTSKVYINNQFVGNTPYDVSITPGEVIIKIDPIVSEGINLTSYETKINLTSGIKTIIKRTFKENEDETSGAVVSFEKVGGDESLITVVSIPDSAQVMVDGKMLGFTPLRVKVEKGDRQLLLSHQGYLEKTLPIKLYPGYKLTAVIKLSKNNTPMVTPTPVAEEKEKVEILDTGTGFLRVRSEPSLNGSVVAQVKPGDSFNVIEKNEEKNWYKIKVNEIEGWVSGEFVKTISTPL